MRSSVFALFWLCLSSLALAAPVGTAFTYQGSLKRDGAATPNDLYDFRFALYADADGGSPLAGPQARDALPVTKGLFTTTLDFGGQFDGQARFLEIQVRRSGEPGFALLSPRQPLSPAPYAINATRVANDSIVAANIQSGAIAAGKIAAGAVAGAEILDGSVTAAELADASVTYAKLADAAVQGSKLADYAVGASKINPYEIQRRVAMLCPRGAPMIGITQSGEPICDHPQQTVDAVYSQRTAVVIRTDGRPLLALAGPRLYDCADAACSSGSLNYLPNTGVPPGNDVSLALRSDGLPVLAYGQDSGAEHLVICGNAACSAGNTVRSFDGALFAAFSHVALRADNTPLVAYFNTSYDTRLYVCNDASCAAGTIRTLTPGASGYSPGALRIRPNGTPVLAMRGFSASPHALYDCNDAGCSSGSLRGLSSGVASRFVLGLAVRGDNRPLATLSTFSDGLLHDCEDAACSSSALRTVLSGEAFSQSAIALRADGRPLIAYVQAGGYTLKLLDCANVDCTGGTARALDQVSADGDAQISLTLRADGRPVLAYPLGSGQTRLLLCTTPACR